VSSPRPRSPRAIHIKGHSSFVQNEFTFMALLSGTPAITAEIGKKRGRISPNL